MKKFFKFVAGAASLAALACGAYYFCKKYICKETSDDFDEFDDDFEDFEDTEDETLVDPQKAKEGREYVSIHISSDNDNNEEKPEESPYAEEKTVAPEVIEEEEVPSDELSSEI